MFSEKLFDHKYDIDDLIFAFCASNKKGRFILNSRNASIFFESEEDIKNSPYTDGDDAGHIREIWPLPKSFINEIRLNSNLKRATQTQQETILNILNKITEPHELPPLFEGAYGGWLRERVKEACLEWLDLHNMIPPSMRHVVDISMPDEKPFKNTKITIE